MNKRHKYTLEEEQFLKEYAPGHTYKEIRDQFNKRFEREITVNNVSSFLYIRNIYTGVKKGYTDEEKQFLKEYIPGHTYKEIECEFNRRFGKEIPRKSLRNFRQYYHLKTGCISSGRFKKNTKGANYRPVGSETVCKNGYVIIKIADPSVWRLKHKYIWEQAYGEIPPGYTLLFADGNPQNITLDNLRLVSRKTQIVMAHEKMLSCGAEYIDTAIAIAELKRARGEAENAKR